MFSRLPIFICSLGLAAQGLALGGPETDFPIEENLNLIANESASDETPAAPAALRTNAPKPVSPSASDVALRRMAPGPGNEHAPLAWFSLGSLAVGGAFYAINDGIDRENVAYTAGDRTRLSTTVAVAGIGALLAAGSYFYYTNRSAYRAETPDDGVDAELSGGPDGEGGAAVSAKLTVPLALLPGFR